MNIRYKKYFKLLITIIWLIIIYIICLKSSSNLPNIELLPHQDKIAHLGLFFILGVTIYFNLYKTLNLKYVILFSLLNSIFHGAITEILQNYMKNGRNGDIYDFIFDILGGILGVITAELLMRKKHLIFKK
jgi:VanZ family protein